MENKIDVVLVTYNQKDYIAQAIDSILSQNFDSFRIIIHDDCSDDGTKEIIEKYYERYPNIILPIFEKKRTFIELGFNKMLRDCISPYINSKYVAYCDGDDYWCDNEKLSIQFSFLENHKEYSMCFCSSYVLEKDGSMKSKHFIGKDCDFGISDILTDEDGIKIATSSIFLRSSIFCDYQDWRVAFPVEDFPMYINAAINGKIHRIGRVMTVYRKFSIGSWSSTMSDFSRRSKNILSFKEGINKFNVYTSGNYQEYVNRLLMFYDYKFAYYNRDYKIVLLSKNRKYFNRLPAFEKASIILQFKMPRVYKMIKKK